MSQPAQKSHQGQNAVARPAPTRQRGEVEAEVQAEPPSGRGWAEKSPGAGVFYLESLSPAAVTAGGSPGPAGPRTVGVPAAGLVPRSPGTQGVGLGVRHTPYGGGWPMVGDACLARVGRNHKPWKQMPASESLRPSQNKGVQGPASLGRQAGSGEARGGSGLPQHTGPPHRDPQPPRCQEQDSPEQATCLSFGITTDRPLAWPLSCWEAKGGFTAGGRKAPGMEPSHGPACRQWGRSRGGRSHDQAHKGRRNHAQQQHKEPLRSLSLHGREPGAAAIEHLMPATFWGPLLAPTKCPASQAQHCQSFSGRQPGSGSTHCLLHQPCLGQGVLRVVPITRDGLQLSGAGSTPLEPPPCREPPQWVLARNSWQKNSNNVPPVPRSF